MTDEVSEKDKSKVSPSERAGVEPALQSLESSRQEYVQSWAVNAQNHASQDHYSWMAERVTGHRRTLEIGCGTGQSTLALLASGHKVICVEENPCCIRSTSEALEIQGYKVKVLFRATALAVTAIAYRLQYREISDAQEADCLIIEGDALYDPGLMKWLMAQPKFDSVVCWLLGTHNARGGNVSIDKSLVKTPKDHRLLVQNLVYELADDVLRPGGILNVIDRGAVPGSHEIQRDVIDGHLDQASVTSLQFRALEFTAHLESNATGSMQMTRPVKSSLAAASRSALISVTFYKPS